MLRRGLQALTVLTLILAIGESHDRMQPIHESEETGAFVPRAEMARLASLGFDAALADYYWLRAIQVVGGGTGSPAGKGELLGRMIDVVTTLDPWVDHPYRFAAVWLTDRPEDVRVANRLLRRGIAHHPDDWRNYFYLGFNQFFYLGENVEAADALEQAATLSGAPAYLPRLATRLRTQSQDLSVVEAFVAQMAQDATDDGLRNNYLAALDAIGVERKARFLDAARDRYRELRGHDIDSVTDLLEGASPLLIALPAPEPASLPEALNRGSRWEIDPDGRIVSSYYGRRYELTFNHFDAERRKRWGVEDQEAGT